jgi:hypothetical protein
MKLKVRRNLTLILSLIIFLSFLVLQAGSQPIIAY